MKIKTLLVALSAASLLASCGGAKWKTYPYKRVLSASEKAALLLKVETATVSKISKLESKMTTVSKSNLSLSKQEIKSTSEFFTKGEMYSEDVDKYHSEENGIVQDGEDVKKEIHALFDEEKSLMAVVEEDSSDGSYSYYQGEFPEGYEGSTALVALSSITSLLNAPTMSAVEDKKGNLFFLQSQEVETFTPIEWEHGTKEQHIRDRVQYVAKLNDDFTLKSITGTMIGESNRDTDTNEFYKKMKVVYEMNVEAKFTYGDRADGSSKLSAYRADAKNSYRITLNPQIKYTAYKADGTELTSATMYPDRALQKGFSKYNYTYSVGELAAKFSEEEIAYYKFNIIGKSISNAKEDPVEFDTPIIINNYLAGNSGTQYVDGSIKMGKCDVYLTLELDVDATAEGASLTNVSAYATPSHTW